MSKANTVESQKRQRLQITDKDVLARIECQRRGWAPSYEGKRAVADLLRVARGSAMILAGLFGKLGEDDQHMQNIAGGLSDALFAACDAVDLDFFHSAGELATTLTKHELAGLLKKELGEIEVSLQGKRPTNR